MNVYKAASAAPAGAGWTGAGNAIDGLEATAAHNALPGSPGAGVNLLISDWSPSLGTSAQAILVKAFYKAVIDMHAYGGPGSSCRFFIEYSTNGGSTWTTLINHQGTPNTIQTFDFTSGGASFIANVNPAQVRVNCVLVCDTPGGASTSVTADIYGIEAQAPNNEIPSMMGFL